LGKRGSLDRLRPGHVLTPRPGIPSSHVRRSLVMRFHRSLARPRSGQSTARRPAPTPNLLSLEPRLAPSGVPTSWVARGAGGGGALYAPQINPANTADIYVASDAGQIFHTTNTGTSWQQVDFRQIQGGRQSQVQFTETATIRYSLDYTAVGGADLVRPSKTTDGGATWVPLANDPTAG